jgi:hypothetical protein
MEIEPFGYDLYIFLLFNMSCILLAVLSITIIFD